jgi:hypothetical protein
VTLDLQSVPLSPWKGDDCLDSWEPSIDLFPLESREGAAPRPAAATPAPSAAVRAVRSNLETIGTLELLKSLTHARATGIVSFETKPEGGLLFEDGLIVAASWGQLSGAPALAELLLLRSGGFRVGAQVREVFPEDPRAPQALLLDALEIVAKRPSANEPAPRRALESAPEPATRILAERVPPAPESAALAVVKGELAPADQPAIRPRSVESGPALARLTPALAAHSTRPLEVPGAPGGDLSATGAQPHRPTLVEAMAERLNGPRPTASGEPAGPIRSKSLWGMDVMPRGAGKNGTNGKNGSRKQRGSRSSRALRGLRAGRLSLF